MTPPMPVARATPSRSWSRSSWTSARPEPAQASIVATIANCAVRSSRRALTRSRTSVGSTAATPAIFTRSPSAHSASMCRTPERPSAMPSQVVATSPPAGVVVPRPVTTTRVRLIAARFRADLTAGVLGDGSLSPGGSGLGALDERDRVTDRLEVLHLVVGDRDAELLLGGHDDLDHGQRVDVEVVDEGLVELDVIGIDAGDLVDDLGEVGADLLSGCHLAHLFLWWCPGPVCRSGSAGGTRFRAGRRPARRTPARRRRR